MISWSVLRRVRGCLLAADGPSRVCTVAIQFHLRLNPIRAQPGEVRQSKLSITMVSHLPITPHCGGLIRALWKCIQTVLDQGICLLQGSCINLQPPASETSLLWECVECKYLCDAAHLMHNMVYGFIFRSFHTRHQRPRLMGVFGAGNFLEVGSLLQGVQKHKSFFWIWYSLKCPYLLKKFINLKNL